MLKPSYAELMDIMNKDNETGDSIKSRYTVVIAAAKRARQLIEGDSPMVDDPDLLDKPLSIAVEELEQGKIKVVPEGMGTVIHIEKESLEEEIKNELEQAAEENSLGRDASADDSGEIEISDEDLDYDENDDLEGLEDLDTLDFSDDPDSDAAPNTEAE